MIWQNVDDGAKLTAQTIRHMLEAHDIDYQVRNSPHRGVYVVTQEFALEVDAQGVASYAPGSVCYWDDHPPFTPTTIGRRARLGLNDA